MLEALTLIPLSIATSLDPCKIQASPIKTADTICNPCYALWTQTGKGSQLQKEKAELLPKEVNVENNFKAMQLHFKKNEGPSTILCGSEKYIPNTCTFCHWYQHPPLSAEMITMSGRCNWLTDHNLEREVFIKQTKHHLWTKTKNYNFCVSVTITCFNF